MSVAAFPMSICVALILYFRPSREVDRVRPVIACLETVYAAESAISKASPRRESLHTGSRGSGRDGAVVDDPSALRRLLLHESDGLFGALA
jgi:hypothetical protein